ncbi:putative laccase [Lupinus albus]|uniref:Putative laccase n=1 Tax=Lupinus albus TaxID=3870 RepID=A0A6A4NZD6_LUPAL|nr:putative laccase [Lupinus albus]
MIAQALQTGGGPNISDAYTINALPGSGSLYITLLCTINKDVKPRKILK